MSDTPDNRDQLKDESLKLAFEIVKNVATLGAGSIVVIGTFMKDIFPRRQSTGALLVSLPIKLLLALAFIFFGLSVLLAANSMWKFAASYGQRARVGRIYPGIGWFYVVYVGFAFASLFLGLIFFGSAVLINLF